MSKLQSELIVFYLDDGTIGGTFQDMLADLRLVELEASKLGLELNHSKSELICNQPSIREAMLLEVQSLRAVNCSNATLLGSPIGDVDCIDVVIMRKIEMLQLMGERLNLLCSYDALTLLRHSFAIPRVFYMLRTAPCFLSSHLKSFDDILRSTLSSIMNIHLDSESSWLQASLPVKAGGIGIRRATQQAPSAFLASAAGCSSIVRQILPLHFIESADACTKAALAVWREDHSHPPLPHPSSCSQRAWDTPKIKATVDIMLESAANDLTKVRLLAISCPESGAWLNALPLSSIGLRMDDDVIRIAIGLRLGLTLCHPHAFSDCGAEMNVDGIHDLSCRYSRGRHFRHSAFNAIVKHSLESAKILCYLEPSGLYRSDGKRLDGASVVPWQRGEILVWDATCSDTFAASHMGIAVREPGAVAAVAAAAEHSKRSKYCDLDATHHFVPIAVGQDVRNFFREVARRVMDVTNEPQSHLSLLQRVAVDIPRGNAVAIWGSTGDGS